MTAREHEEAQYRHGHKQTANKKRKPGRCAAAIRAVRHMNLSA
jgi:hypothetical protein